MTLGNKCLSLKILTNIFLFRYNRVKKNQGMQRACYGNCKRQDSDVILCQTPPHLISIENGGYWINRNHSRIRNTIIPATQTGFFKVIF